MKLLFIENRYKTFFFDAIAKTLAQTHEIFWIVQNHNFMPSTGNITKIPLPNNKNIDVLKKVDIDYDGVINSDRQLNFFNKSDKQYLYHYANEIDKNISEIQPDFVFGESTAFHELLAIEICKKKDILFLSPSSCRYPEKYFSFYKYDTLMPYEGSNSVLDEEEASEIISAIANRVKKPDYMKKVKRSKKREAANKIKIIKSYYLGEHYNTPSPKVKFLLEINKKKIIKKWNNISSTEIDNSKFAMLYPLQMQPEANIDVWGRKHRDQLLTIKKIHKQLSNDEILYIKPNPKSKYELSEELIAYIIQHNDIKALHHNVSMDDIFNTVDLFVTVTGTIAIECIFSGKPVITLIKTLNNRSKNCIYADNFDQIRLIINQIKNKTFPETTFNDKKDFLDLLTKTSFKGVISDPYSDANSISEENIEKVCAAFNNLLDE